MCKECGAPTHVSMYLSAEMLRMARAPHAKPSPPFTPPPAQMPPLDDDKEDKVDEEELDALAFEDSQLMRSGASTPIDIPGSSPSRPPGSLPMPARRAPLPIAGLRSLDRHNWDSECALLGKWAAGAGVGAFANSVADGFFAPGSPPRRKFYY